jgi:integrase
MLLVYLGLRKDELRRIRLADVDLEARTLIVQRKGGHVDTLPIGFEHVYNALALYLRDRERHADVRTTRGYLHPGLDRLAEGMKRVEAEAVGSKDAV